MGNMSGDSDSICGILCLAYYHFMKQNGLTHIIVDHATVYHIPLLNLSRSDLESRFESLYILETYGVDTKILITLDDVDLPRVIEHANTSIVLYDHNVPNSKQIYLC